MGKSKGVFISSRLKKPVGKEQIDKLCALAAEISGRKKIKNLYDTSVCPRCGIPQAGRVCEGTKCAGCGNEVLMTRNGLRWGDYAAE